MALGRRQVIKQSNRHVHVVAEAIPSQDLHRINTPVDEGPADTPDHLGTPINTFSDSVPFRKWHKAIAQPSAASAGRGGSRSRRCF